MPKKMPVRQCIACRTKREKTELLRIVKSPESALSLDAAQKLPGRGAYLCRSAECLKKAQKTGALSRALKTPVPEELWAQLKAETEAADG